MHSFRPPLLLLVERLHFFGVRGCEVVLLAAVRLQVEKFPRAFLAGANKFAVADLDRCGSWWKKSLKAARQATTEAENTRSTNLRTTPVARAKFLPNNSAVPTSSV